MIPYLSSPREYRTLTGETVLKTLTFEVLVHRPTVYYKKATEQACNLPRFTSSER